MNLIPLTQIRPSPHQLRKHFDKQKLAELTESVKQHGILQPLLVRFLDAGQYELIAGERRFRAAKAAGLEKVPAVGRNLTDKETLEIIIIENLQREDLHPLEEADGYKCLVEAGLTPSQIGERIGKTKSYVNKTLQLLHLGPQARKAFLEGKLLRSTALLLARIPAGKDLQEKALAEITWHGGMNPKRAGEHIQENFMLRLKDAPFDPRDEKLCPRAGACSTCPKRTGNQQELFDDITAKDACTDPACYRQKEEAWWARQKAEAEEKGLKVLEGAAARRAHHSGNNVDLKDRAWSLEGKRANKTWADNLKDAIKLGKVQPVMTRDDSGEVRVLVDKNEARKALGLKPERTSTLYDKQAIARKKKKQTLAEIGAKAVGLALARFRELGNDSSKTAAALQKLLARAVYEHCGIDACAFTAKRRGWCQTIQQAHAAIEKWLKQNHSREELQEFMVELLLLQPAAMSWDPRFSRNFIDACALLGVDLKKLEQEHAAAAADKKKPSSKPKLKRQTGSKGGEISAAAGARAEGTQSKMPSPSDPSIGMDPAVVAWGKKLGAEDPAKAPGTEPVAEILLKSEAVTAGPPFQWDEKSGICQNPQRFIIPHRSWTIELKLANQGDLWGSGFELSDEGMGVHCPVRRNQVWPSRAGAVQQAGEKLLVQLRKWNAPVKTILATTAEIKKLRQIGQSPGGQDFQVQ